MARLVGMKPGTEQRHGHRQTEVPLLPPMARSFPTVLTKPPLPPSSSSSSPPPIQSQRVVVRVCVRDFQQPPSVEVTFMREREKERKQKRARETEGREGRGGGRRCDVCE